MEMLKPLVLQSPHACTDIPWDISIPPYPNLSLPQLTHLPTHAPTFQTQISSDLLSFCTGLIVSQVADFFSFGTNDLTQMTFGQPPSTHTLLFRVCPVALM